MFKIMYHTSWAGFPSIRFYNLISQTQFGDLLLLLSSYIFPSSFSQQNLFRGDLRNGQVWCKFTILYGMVGLCSKMILSIQVLQYVKGKIYFWGIKRRWGFKFLLQKCKTQFSIPQTFISLSIVNEIWYKGVVEDDESNSKLGILKMSAIFQMATKNV